jgi:hypothetical protein
MMASLAFATTLAAVGPSAAQNKINIIISTTSEDAVGRQLVFQVRDKIAKSGQLQLGTKGDRGLNVHIVTLDPDNDGAQTNTIYSFVLTIPGENLPLYLTNYVGVCGKTRTESCADTLFGAIGEQLEEIRAALK